MPGFQIANNLGYGAPANVSPFYSYTWEIQQLFGDFPSQDGKPSPLIYVRDCTLPTFSGRREEAEGAGMSYKYADGIVWEDIKVTFYDIPIGNVKLGDLLKKWRNRIWTAEYGLNVPDEYKSDSIITSFNSDQSVSTQWKLVGSWPQTIRNGELTYTRSEIKLVEVTVCYDWAVEGGEGEQTS